MSNSKIYCNYSGVIQTFAMIRSNISTMQKQGMTAIDDLHAAFFGNPSFGLP